MQATKRVFLDHYGIWPGQTGVDRDGRAYLQDPPQGVKLAIQQASLSGVCMIPERPWEAGGVSPFCVIREGGALRLWYCASPGGDAADYVAHAQSPDGFGWERPELGLVDYDGSRANNLLLSTEEFNMHSVFVDPSAPGEERYKAIAPGAIFYRGGVPDPAMRKAEFRKLRAMLLEEGVAPEELDREVYFRSILRGAVSPDGLRWRVLEEPILDVGRSQLDTQNVAAYDEGAGEYRAYLRGHLERRRLVRLASGQEFRVLGPTRPVFWADAQDPIDEDIYSPCYTRPPGGDQHLLFPSVYHRMESTLDLAMATSRDGLLWARPSRDAVLGRRGFGPECSMVFGMPNLVPLDGGRWGLLVQGQFRRHDGATAEAAPPEWRWATWGADRLVALEAPAFGRVTLVEQAASGRELVANYATASGGWLKIELVRPPTTPASPVEALEGFGLDEADALAGDEWEGVATWRGSSDLAALAGRKVSVRVSMSRAKLFSISY